MGDKSPQFGKSSNTRPGDVVTFIRKGAYTTRVVAEVRRNSLTTEPLQAGDKSFTVKFDALYTVVRPPKAGQQKSEPDPPPKPEKPKLPPEPKAKVRIPGTALQPGDEGYEA